MVLLNASGHRGGEWLNLAPFTTTGGGKAHEGTVLITKPRATL